MGAAQSQSDQLDPCDWWASYGGGTPELQQLAMLVCSQPASASSAEQSWSEYDFVHSKRRNRLKSDAATKLVYVHSSLRLVEKQTSLKRHADIKYNSCVTPKSVVHREDVLDGNASDTDGCECDPDSDE